MPIEMQRVCQNYQKARSSSVEINNNPWHDKRVAHEAVFGWASNIANALVLRYQWQVLPAGDQG